MFKSLMMTVAVAGMSLFAFSGNAEAGGCRSRGYSSGYYAPSHGYRGGYSSGYYSPVYGGNFYSPSYGGSYYGGSRIHNGGLRHGGYYGGPSGYYGNRGYYGGGIGIQTRGFGLYIR